jgi:hypothetical protein
MRPADLSPWSAGRECRAIAGAPVQRTAAGWTGSAASVPKQDRRHNGGSVRVRMPTPVALCDRTGDRLAGRPGRYRGAVAVSALGHSQRCGRTWRFAQAAPALSAPAPVTSAPLRRIAADIMFKVNRRELLRTGGVAVGAAAITVPGTAAAWPALDPSAPGWTARFARPDGQRGSYGAEVIWQRPAEQPAVAISFDDGPTRTSRIPICSAYRSIRGQPLVRSLRTAAMCAVLSAKTGYASSLQPGLRRAGDHVRFWMLSVIVAGVTELFGARGSAASVRTGPPPSR